VQVTTSWGEQSALYPMGESQGIPDIDVVSPSNRRGREFERQEHNKKRGTENGHSTAQKSGSGGEVGKTQKKGLNTEGKGDRN